MSENTQQQAPHPRVNPCLLGHDAAERTLARAWRSGRMVHAWLITGPRGIGKATLAYRCARFVLIRTGHEMPKADDLADTMEIEPDHPVFARVASGGHADLKVLERGVDAENGRLRREITVAEVRDMSSFLRLTPAEGGWRVIVVDAIDEMNRNAANAMLKVLEEPPPRTLFLLVCHAPGRILPTIVSRCRRLPLTSLDDATVLELLRRYRPDLGADARRSLARLGNGSIGEALALADAGGLDLYHDLVKLMARMPTLDIPEVHALGDKVARRGDETAFATLTKLVDRWLAAMIVAAARGDEPPEIVSGEGEVRRRLLARAALEQWMEVWEKVTDLMARAEGASLDRKQVVVAVFLALAQTAKCGSPASR